MSSELYYPFATGAGASADEVAWGNIFLALGRPGVLIGEGTEFTVAGTGGAAVTVGTGKAVCFGHYYELLATSDALTVAPNSGATRYDRVVIRFDFGGGDTAHVVVITGSTGTLVGYSQDRAGFYDIPICVLAVPTGAGIGPGALHPALDRWAMPLHALPPGTTLPFFSPEAFLPKYAIILDGSTYSRFQYERLWNFWFNADLPVSLPARVWGCNVTAGPGTDTVKIPDMRGRAFFGLDNMGGAEPNNPRLDDANRNVLGNAMGSNTINGLDVGYHFHGVPDLDHDGADLNYSGVLVLNPTGASNSGIVAGAASDHVTQIVQIGSAMENGDHNFGTEQFPLPGDQNPDSKIPPAMLGNWMMLV